MNVSALDDFPVGIALPFHGTADLVPQGWIIYDGSEFNKLANPKNAVIFSSGRFPDYKGRMPEGYLGESDGPVASEQPGGIMAHNHTATSTASSSFSGSALPVHHHMIANTDVSGDTPALTNSNYLTSTGNHDSSTSYGLNGSTKVASVGLTSDNSAGTPSGTVSTTVTTTIASTGETRNTVDRVICLWIGKLG